MFRWIYSCVTVIRSKKETWNIVTGSRSRWTREWVTPSQPVCVISHREAENRVTRQKPCLASLRAARHSSTMYPGLVSSQKALMEQCFGITESRPCSRQDGGARRRGKTETRVKPMKRRGGISRENSCSLPSPPCFPSDTDANSCRQLPHQGLCERQKPDVSQGVGWFSRLLCTTHLHLARPNTCDSSNSLSLSLDSHRKLLLNRVPFYFHH